MTPSDIGKAPEKEQFMCLTEHCMAQAAHAAQADNLLIPLRMRINVCTYLARGEALPSAFYLGGRRLRVVAIANRWINHPYQYFEVITDDARRFVLRFEPNTICWELYAVYAAPARVKKPEAAKTSRWKFRFSSATTAK
jgi:hypothetical protein